MHRREASRANAIWQADHAQLDILVLRDDGSAAKPWLTIVIDDYRRAVAGYYLAFEPPSVLRTALALLQGIWRKEDPHWPVCGIPSVLYTDHGADFTSQHIRQAAPDLKMQLIFATPGQPRSRGRIERFFRTVNEMFLCDLDGYLHRSRRKPTLTLESLEKQFRSFLLEVYHRRPSQESGETPLERWEKGGFLPIFQTRSNSSTRCSCLPCGRARCAATVSHSNASGIFHPCSPPTSGKRSPCVLIPGYGRSSHLLPRPLPLSCHLRRVSRRDGVLARDCAGSQREAARVEQILRDRREVVDSLLELRRGQVEKKTHAKQPDAVNPQQHRLKRYWNERLPE